MSPKLYFISLYVTLINSVNAFQKNFIWVDLQKGFTGL